MINYQARPFSGGGSSPKDCFEEGKKPCEHFCISLNEDIHDELIRDALPASGFPNRRHARTTLLVDGRSLEAAISSRMVPASRVEVRGFRGEIIGAGKRPSMTVARVT